MSRSWSEMSVEELLPLARAGEQKAWDELFSRFKEQLKQRVARSIKRAPTAGVSPSDIVQETSISAYQHFKSFKGTTEGEWRTWLQRSADNEVKDTKRKAGSQKRDESGTISLNDPDTPQPIDPQPSPSQLTSREEQVRELLKYLHQLHDAQREALTLHLLESLTVKEVAAQMNLALKNEGKDKKELTEDAVSGLIRRGVKTLKRRMSQEASAEPEEDQNEAMSRNMADVALLTYLRRRSAGEEIDPDAFADSHPACAEELRGLIHWVEQLRALRYTPSI